MAITYDTLGSTVTIYPRGTVAPGQLNTEVAIVAGYDSDNADASVSEGEATVVNTGTEAGTMFGEDSELAWQAELAFNNGATAVHGVPPEETSTTETFGDGSSTSTGTLSDHPFDPNVHPGKEITAQDVTESEDVDVNIVYEDSPATPSEPNTINISMTTNDWEADSSSEYDITYAHGDYTAAIETAVGRTVRAVGVSTEHDEHKETLDEELDDAASNFRFHRGVTGSQVDIETSGTGSYEPTVDDWRSVEVAPSRGSTSNGDVRTVGAIAGMVASQPIDVTGSITYDTVSGFESLRTEFRPSEAEAFGRVTAITDEYEVASGTTTSSERVFQDIYKAEIIDFIVEGLYTRVKDYSGGSNADSAQRRFKSRLKRYLASQAAPNATPPLLASGDGSQPYTVTVDQGSVDTETDVDIGIDVAPIAKEVTLGVSVGPIQFTGASV